MIGQNITMTRKPTPDSLSLALFGSGGDAHGEGAPGLSDLQQAASDSSRAMVLNQPMQSVALRPTRGAITRHMNLMWLKIIQEIQLQPEAPVYKIPVKALVEFIGDAKNYDRLKDNLKALNAVQVEWNNVGPDGEQWGVSSLLSQAKVTKKGNTSTIEVSLPPDINKGVRELKQFSALNLLLARELTNPAALNLFRIAVAYETNPSRVTFRAPPEEWEPLLRGTPRQTGTEFEYKYFKRDTVKPALAEVNRLTNLTLEMIEHMEGRTVKELQFRINSKNSIDIDGAISDSASKSEIEAIAQLKEIGVRSVEARQLISAYGADRVRRNVEYMKRKQGEDGAKIRTPSAYIKAAVQGDYADAAVIEGDVTLVTSEKAVVKDRAAEREMAMERFKAARRTEAAEMFMEMTRRDSDNYWDVYTDNLKQTNNQTLLGAATTKGLKAKIVQIDFYDWLAEKLQGPITDANFMDYLLSQSATKSAPRRKASRK